MSVDERSKAGAEISYTEGGAELLDRMEKLWLELNRHHLERSSNFRDRFEDKTFAERKKEMLAKAAGGELRIWLALSPDREGPVAYCVALIDSERTGEIESIFVLSGMRRRGVGRELVARSFIWMDQRSVLKKKAEVAWGNQEALGFYERLGLFPRRVVLESMTRQK